MATSFAEWTDPNGLTNLSSRPEPSAVGICAFFSCSHAGLKAQIFARLHQSIVSVMLVEAVIEDEVSVPVMVSV